MVGAHHRPDLTEEIWGNGGRAFCSVMSDMVLVSVFFPTRLLAYPPTRPAGRAFQRTRSDAVDEVAVLMVTFTL